MSANVLQTPARLVSADGVPAVGVFDRPFADVNLIDARPRVGGRALPRALSRMHLKQWQHVAVVHPDVFVGLSIVDAAYLRTSWCHVVDRRSGRQFEHQRQSPLLDLRVARHLHDDRCHVHARGYRADIHNHLVGGGHRVEATIDARRGRPSVALDLWCPHPLEGPAAIEPLVVAMPVGDGRAAYSHKVALPSEGQLVLDGEVIDLAQDATTTIWDVHKAHYPREMFWNWATFAGWDAEGRHVALNLTRNVNPDDEDLNENVFWLDGRRHHFGAARFTFDRARAADPNHQWQLGTRCGAVDLRFRPAGERAERIELGVLRSVFRQPYGVFEGTVTLPSGTVAIDGQFGVCEDHEARW